MQKGFPLFVAISWSLTVSSPAGQTIEHPEWKTYFDSNGLEGTIVESDLVKGETHVYNPLRAAAPFIPGADRSTCPAKSLV